MNCARVMVVRMHCFCWCAKVSYFSTRSRTDLCDCDGRMRCGIWFLCRLRRERCDKKYMKRRVIGVGQTKNWWWLFRSAGSPMSRFVVGFLFHTDDDVCDCDEWDVWSIRDIIRNEWIDMMVLVYDYNNLTNTFIKIYQGYYCYIQREWKYFPWCDFWTWIIFCTIIHISQSDLFPNTSASNPQSLNIINANIPFYFIGEIRTIFSHAYCFTFCTCTKYTWVFTATPNMLCMQQKYVVEYVSFSGWCYFCIWNAGYLCESYSTQYDRSCMHFSWQSVDV